MKKLINKPGAVVPEMLEGLVAINPGLMLLDGETVVIRAGWDQAGVAVISGGGAGHEPAHAGYVGPGLLTAAVAGDVFTSPSVDAVLAAIRAVTGGPGALLIVKNYTGDRLNFGLAAEIARTEGLRVEVVVVDDDVALGPGDGTSGAAGRRGIAGTVLVHKVAGAAAAAGLDLDGVKCEAEAAIAAVGTMGVALTPCIVPAAGVPGFELGADEVELGLGIHGEAGVRRAPIGTAQAMLQTMVEVIIADRGLSRGDQIALLVNNLGGTPAMELMIATREAAVACKAHGIQVERAWCGSFLTALEMAGCSISLMRLDAGRLARLDAPASAPAWPGSGAPAHLDRPRAPARTAPPPHPSEARDPRVDRVLRAVAATLRAAEPALTRMDQVVGDGDLGISLARGSAAIERDLPTYPTADVAGTLRALSATLRRALGGSSGPFYAVALLRASEVLRTQPGKWGDALRAGCDGIQALGGAVPGDCTMLDALDPAAAALAATGLDAAVTAAEDGAERTAAMLPRRGRSTYIGDRALGQADPGAKAVALWLRSVRDALY
jgi:dihydroxyacetone kinase